MQQQDLPPNLNLQQISTGAGRQQHQAGVSGAAAQLAGPGTASTGGIGVGGGGRADAAAAAAAGVPRRALPARVQFCPGRRDVYGAVNCQPPEHQQVQAAAAPVSSSSSANITNAAEASSSSTSRMQKPGPVLLELRHLQPEVDPQLRRAGKCLASRTVAVSRGYPSLGSGVASTCLSFRPAGGGGGGGGMCNALQG